MKNYSKYGKGWYHESDRHRLARLGIRTGRKSASQGFGLGTKFATGVSYSKKEKEPKEVIIQSVKQPILDTTPSGSEYRTPGYWVYIIKQPDGKFRVEWGDERAGLGGEEFETKEDAETEFDRKRDVYNIWSKVEHKRINYQKKYTNKELKKKGPWATVGGRIEDFDKIFDEKGPKAAFKEIKKQYGVEADRVYRGLLVYRRYGVKAYYDEKKINYAKQLSSSYKDKKVAMQSELRKEPGAKLKKIKTKQGTMWAWFKEEVNYAYTTGDLPGIVTTGLGTAGAEAVGWVPAIVAVGATKHIVKQVKSMTKKKKKRGR